ncbi:U3 snoRNP protein [Parelaphostrongylus tenuis]|uniref:U3 snoRNP protein n=1 Tax=Parelaphostrongylus tenuis TaxID=148309 RepID=A0AAD5N8Q7_PARTN|nr:U3 snoRNP protein [Parelaphostrongylus tenuis]
MGEFVEQSLECLLSTFEQLGELQLFTNEELNIFIKRCRQFEYRLNKQDKTPRERRLNCWDEKKLIDRPLRKKVASLYRRAADRFQGDWHQWERLISFLKENKMRRELAAAYTRALQIYVRNENLRRDFALWQFFDAASPQNARTQILASLRLFPNSAILYVAFFTIEIHFVDKVLKRRKFITEEKGKRGSETEDHDDSERVYDGEIDDNIMNLNVAKAVVEQALLSVQAHDAAGMLMEMWRECNKIELVPNIEKVRSFIVEELKKFDNEQTRLFEIELACRNGASKFDMFDEALKKTCTEKMHRLYLQWLREVPKDAFVDLKIRDLLHDLCDNGWMNEKDWCDLEKEIELYKEEFGVEFIERCLERRPHSVAIWTVFLENCLDEASMSLDEFREKCNCALDKVDPNDSFPIWQRAIEYSIVQDPRHTEQVFKDALLKTNAIVKSKIKILFLDYLDELLNQSKITADKLRKKVMELVNNKPNSAEFYCALHSQRARTTQPRL